MKQKTSLVLMEQMVMLLVFALAAAVCLQAFVTADRLSRQSEARDQAIVLVQSAAEVIRHYGGDTAHALSAAANTLGGHYEQGVWQMRCDKDGKPVTFDSAEYFYYLKAEEVSIDMLSNMTAVRITAEMVNDKEEEVFLFEVKVAWQLENKRSDPRGAENYE